VTGRAAVLGLGARGTRWAHACLDAGWEVAGFDPDEDTGHAMTGGALWRREATISGAVERADLVICCLPERIELLRPVLQRAQASATEKAVVAVVSAAFDVDEVQGNAIKPSKVLRVFEDANGQISLDLGTALDAQMRVHVTKIMSGLGAKTVVLSEYDDNAG